MTEYKDKRHVLTVEGLTNHGQPFVCLNEKTVRFNGIAVPGDKIEVFINSRGQAREGEIIEPSPNRVKPDCFFHGPCGGCDLLELSEKGRKNEKQAMIERSIARINPELAPLIHPFASSKEIIRYLPRVRLHQSRNYEKRESGFLASEAYRKQISGSIVPVTACALITPPLARRLVAARRILSQIPIFLESLTLMSSSSRKSDRVSGHAVLMKGKNPGVFYKDLLKIMRAAQLKGLSVASIDGKIKEVHGSVSVTGLIAPEVDGGPYDAEPGFFVQGNVFQNPVLVRKIVDFCKPVKGRRIVEGFAGAGNFTLALAAKGARVEAIESHPGAVRTGKKNIFKSGFKERFELIEGDAIKELAKLPPRPDVLLLDPPRNGTPGIGRIVKKLCPERIVYVYCDLDAMENDSISLQRSGYKLKEVAGIDLYPRTHHVEVICVYDKS